MLAGNITLYIINILNAILTDSMEDRPPVNTQHRSKRLKLQSDLNPNAGRS